jgi:hypothetical protein
VNDLASTKALKQRSVLAELQEGECLVRGDVGIDRQKLIDAFPGFQEIDQRLNRNARSREARCSGEDILIDADCAGQRGLLF